MTFIERPRTRPFFLYFAHSFPHIPLHASAAFRGTSGLGLYGDVVAEIDWSLGQILQALARRKIEENTLVIFTSDHGPWYQGSTGLLRGRKGTTYEGGVRIALVARLPGSLPAGHTCGTLTSHLDLLPTLAQLAGARLPAYGSTPLQLDGLDIWPVLSGAGPAPERQALLGFSSWMLECARWNDWKLHLARANMPAFLPAPRQGVINMRLRQPELYDLARDPKESYDVAARHPEIVAQIERSVTEQLATLPARVQTAWATAGQHPSSPWMPAGAYDPESTNMEPGTRADLSGADAARLRQRFR